MDNPAGAGDFSLLPEDGVLFLGLPGKGSVLFTQQQLDGKILRQCEVNRPISASLCRPLPNGDIFLASRDKAMQVTPAGDPVYLRRFEVADGDFRGFPYEWPQLALNGRIVCPWEERQQLLGWVEFDPFTGALVKKVKFQGNTKIPHNSRAVPIQSLPGGHYLIGVFESSFVYESHVTYFTTRWTYLVLEVDELGKIVWQQKLPWGLNVRASKLRNGNYQVGFVEFDAGGKIASEVIPEKWGLARVVLPLVGLGFDNPRPQGFDLATSVPYWVKDLRSKKPYIRGRSATALAEIAKKDPSAVPPLIEAFDDPDEEVRKRALEGLAEAGAPALDGLLKAAKDPRLNVRWRAVADLRQFENDGARVVPVLVESLKDENQLVRKFAADALSKPGRGSAQAVHALVESLDDKDELVARAAALALGHIGPAAKPAIPKLFECMKGKRNLVAGTSSLALPRLE